MEYILDYSVILNRVGGKMPFGEELEALRPRLRNYALVLEKNPMNVDDLVQTTLLRAWQRKHLFDGRDLWAWTSTILHRSHINNIRRARRDIEKEFAYKIHERMLSIRTKNAEQEIFDRLTLRDLGRAIARLSQEQRQVLLLATVENMKYDDIAGMLHVLPGTVRSRLARGREALRRIMDEPDRSGRRSRIEPCSTLHL